MHIPSPEAKWGMPGVVRRGPGLAGSRAGLAWVELPGPGQMRTIAVVSRFALNSVCPLLTR